MATDESVLGRLRQSAHTGENRCWPCTAVNVVVAGGFTLAIVGGLSLVVAASAAVGAGGAFLAASLLAIAVRGYLVPGTPELTQRYLPEALRTRIHDESAGTDADGWETLERREEQARNAVDPEEFLLDAGAIRDGEVDLELTPETRHRLDDRLDTLRRAGVSDADLADLFDVDVSEIERVERDTPAVEVDSRIRRWPSKAAFVGDVATHQVLAETTSEWSRVPLQQRLDVLRALRSFSEHCPLCDGALVPKEEVVKSCCSDAKVVAISCADCDARILEMSTGMAAGAVQ